MWMYNTAMTYKVEYKMMSKKRVPFEALCPTYDGDEWMIDCNECT